MNFWQKHQSFALFLFLFCCHIYTFPRWADPNQNSRLDMVVAVVEDGTFQIDNYVANTVDYAKVGDHYYSDKAPGAAFLAIPIYAVFKLVLDSPLLSGFTERLAQSEAFRTTLRAEGSGIYTDKVKFALAQVALALATNALPTAILGVLLFHSLRYFAAPTAIRLLIAIAYSFLTPAFAYANAFYGHQLSAALLFAAFYLILYSHINNSRMSILQLLLVGLLLGYSVVTEYPTLLVAAILFLYTAYTLWQQRQLSKIVYLMLTAGLLAAVWMLYNTLIFGGPLNLGYSNSELWTEQHHTGFMSLTLPHWEAIWGITFSQFRGLFILAPWLLLSLPGFYFWWRSGHARAAWWTSAASVMAIGLFNASSAMWWGGYAIGPRYLLPMLPFLTLASAFAFLQWRDQRWFQWLAGLAFTGSLLVGWGLTLAGQAFPPDYLYNPLLEYALPNWQQGNIARNLGTLLGLRGIWSLLPLTIFLVLGIWQLLILTKTNPATNPAIRNS